VPDNTSLRTLQAALIGFLRDGDNGVEALVAEQPPLSPAARLAIYGNAYGVRLRQALETDHEMLAAYLGDGQFAEMADRYIRAYPSSVTSLRHFGAQLPEFLRRQSPYNGLPVLAELAAFERLMLDVFDAADAPRADLAELQALAPADWPNMKVRLHPSVQRFSTQSNAVAIWQALKAGQAPPEAELQMPGDWVLWRGIDRLSQFRSLPPTERLVLEAVFQGETFAGLCESLLPHLAEDTISETVLGCLLGWLEAGMVSRLIR
jgi:hypothetical protein